MANQKLTHTIEWEQIGGNYRIIKLTGSKRQPTLDEAREYLREHHLPEEIWCCGFYNNQEASDGYFDEYEINKTLTLYEYAKYKEGGCPILVQVLDAILPILISLLELISPLLEALIPILQPILELLALLLEPLIQLLDLILPPLIEVIRVVADVLTGVLSGAFSFVTDIINSVITGPLGGLLEMLKNIITFITSVFKGDWNSAWKALGNIPVGIINGVISGFESLLNFFINGINKITKGLSSVWTWIGIPAIPAIPTVSFGRIPQLAEGGVLEKGQVGFLEGDGDEAVVPLEKNTGWIQKVANKIYEFNLEATQNTADVAGCTEMLADRITASIDNQTSVLSNVLNTILQAIYKLDEGLGDKLYDAMSGLQFRINEREFARLVKEV